MAYRDKPSEIEPPPTMLGSVLLALAAPIGLMLFFGAVAAIYCAPPWLQNVAAAVIGVVCTIFIMVPFWWFTRDIIVTRHAERVRRWKERNRVDG